MLPTFRLPCKMVILFWKGEVKVIDVPEWLLRQQKEKERLERTLPNNVIKGVPLPYLKKVGHILEIPRCGSLNKRQLI